MPHELHSLAGTRLLHIYAYVFYLINRKFSYFLLYSRNSPFIESRPITIISVWQQKKRSKRVRSIHSIWFVFRVCVDNI